MCDPVDPGHGLGIADQCKMTFHEKKEVKIT
jgi:hypothetical protein